MTIGITPETLQQTTHVGRLLIRPSQFTTHVRPVGVSLTGEKMVYGQRRDFMLLHSIVQIKEYLSAYHLLLQLGTLLRVFWATTLETSKMSVATATTGLRLLTTTPGLFLLTAPRTSCISAKVAMSVRRTASIARAVYLSVVSKNNS